MNPPEILWGGNAAGILVGGATAAPKVRINVKLAAVAWALNPEIREDLLNGISEFAYTGMTAFTQIAIKYAFLKGRQGIKSLAKKHPGLVEKISPKIAKQIEKWGEEDIQKAEGRRQKAEGYSRLKA